jgi:hypothetical protein
MKIKIDLGEINLGPLIVTRTISTLLPSSHLILVFKPNYLIQHEHEKTN